jgi:hypothetical protein
MNIQPLLNDLQELNDLAAKYYPPKSVRAGLLRDLEVDLKSASSDEERNKVLIEISQLVRGGMGRYGDVSLVFDKEITRAQQEELVVKFYQLITKVYTKAKELITSE